MLLFLTRRHLERSTTWLTVFFVVVFLAAGLLQTRQLAAQSDEPLEDFVEEGMASPAPMEMPEAAAGLVERALLPRQPGQSRVYLPVVYGRSQFTAQFAVAVDDNLNPVSPAMEFPAGTRSVYAVVSMSSLAGQRWSTEWYRNNLRIPGLVASGTVPAGQQEARMVRRLSYANNGPLPEGTYNIVVSINDRRAFEAELRILP